MAVSLKASKFGLETVDRARRKKGWTKTEKEWCDSADTSVATLKRFWRRLPIRQETFVAITEAVEVENWQQLVDDREIPEFEAASDPDNIVGETIRHRYKILKHLGGNQARETYLAEDMDMPETHRCIVKKLNDRSKEAEKFKERFEREARVLYLLGNHDQIPRLLANFQEGEDFYLVEEYIQGEKLAEKLVKGQSWPEDDAIDLLKEILEVLKFVHNQDFIHRNISPKNIIQRKSDGKIVLINFGKVKLVEKGIDSFSGIEVEAYVAPELANGTPKLCSDIYAVGLIGIEALTGLNHKELPRNYETGNISWKNSDDKTNCDEVLNKMVCYFFRERYQSAAEALEALDALKNLETSRSE